MATMASKRKRESVEIPNPRAAPGMTGTAADFDQHYLQHDEEGIDHPDANMDFAAALAQHNADLGDAGDSQHPHGPNSARPGPHETSGHSTSDTAAAAMAQYHTMTVPQSTEQAFMSQATESGDRPGSSHGGAGAHHRTSSFGDFDISEINKDGQANSNGDTSPNMGNSQSTPGPKPQVGTDEWHKVRRDNHKEGVFNETCLICDLESMMLTLISPS